MEEIVKQSIEVRRLQKKYFASRSREVLEKSKKEEEKLDRLIADYLKSKEKSKTLFS